MLSWKTICLRDTVVVGVNKKIQRYESKIQLTQPMDPEKKSLNFIFPTKYVIPKSLKFSHWLSEPNKVQAWIFLGMAKGTSISVQCDPQNMSSESWTRLAPVFLWWKTSRGHTRFLVPKICLDSSRGTSKTRSQKKTTWGGKSDSVCGLLYVPFG